MSRRVVDRPRLRRLPSSRRRRRRLHRLRLHRLRLHRLRPHRRPAATSEDSYAALMRLKELLDAGVLTQAEFDAEKQKILGA